MMIISLSIITNLQAQDNSCPATWGQATFKAVQTNADLEKICNENPTVGKAVKKAVKSSASSGSGNGYKWKKVNGNITLMFDIAKWNYNNVIASIKKFLNR